MKKILLCLLVAASVLSCSKPYVIVQVADPQLGFDADVKSQEPGAVYVDDLTYEMDYLNKAVNHINVIKPDAVVFTGDNVHRPANEHQWFSLLKCIGRIHPEIKTFFVPGNHDVLITERGVDVTPFAVYLGQERFCYKERGVNLVGLNTNYIKFDDTKREEEQFEWLKKVLKKEKSSDVTLVFGHHPFFKEHIDEDDSSQIQKSKRCRYFDLFKSMDVAAVYAGHLHSIREGEYEGIPMKTMTAVAYQLGDSQPSIRVITVSRKGVSDEIFLL